ncbi:MAG: hypothetical protein LBF22_12925 [Deltaproteobacteria bacterium]|nr:hypothetical protein [Deltaproteobacteria bacterium]
MDFSHYESEDADVHAKWISGILYRKFCFPRTFGSLHPSGGCIEVKGGRTIIFQ